MNKHLFVVLVVLNLLSMAALGQGVAAPRLELRSLGAPWFLSFVAPWAQNWQMESSHNFTDWFLVRRITNAQAGALTMSGEGLNVDHHFFRVRPMPTKPMAMNGGGISQVKAGQPSFIQIQYSGSPPMSVEWRKDGQVLVGTNRVTTTPLLTYVTFTAATTNDAGSYSVVFKNSYGSTTNAGTMVQVTP